MKIITYVLITLSISSGITFAETDSVSIESTAETKIKLLTQPVMQEKVSVATENLSEYEKYQQNKVLHDEQRNIRMQMKKEYQAIQRKQATKEIMARAKK